MSYAKTFPRNTLPSYGQYVSNIDLPLAMTQGQCYLANSLMICGKGYIDLDPTGETPTYMTPDVKLYMDNEVGWASCFQRCAVTVNGSTVDSANPQVPSYIKLQTKCDNSVRQSFTSARLVSHGTCGSVDVQANGILCGQTLVGSGSDPTHICEFAFKPPCVLNNLSGNMSGNLYRDIQVSLGTANNTDVLFGEDYVNYPNAAYIITELYMKWQYAPDTTDGKTPVNGIVINYQGSNLITDNPAVNVILTSPTESMTATFFNLDDQQLGYNQLSTDQIPYLTRVQFQVNQINSIITFPLDTKEEILYNALRSMGSSDGHSLFSFHDEQNLYNSVVGLVLNSESSGPGTIITTQLSTGLAGSSTKGYLMRQFLKSVITL